RAHGVPRAFLLADPVIIHLYRRSLPAVSIVQGCSRRILLPQLVEKPLAVGGDFPGIRPKAEGDAPPVVGAAALQELRHELIEVELALAEGGMGAGVVLVEAAVGIDEVDVGDPALELLEQLDFAAA